MIRDVYNATDSNGWIPSSATDIMTIGTIDSSHNVSYDNGCFGFMSPYVVNVSGIPSVDPGVAQIKLVGVNRHEVCTLTDEQVEFKITNTGVQPCVSTPLALKVYEGPNLINTYFDTCNITVLPNDTITYVFSQTINLAANTSNIQFNLVGFSNLSSDVIHLNDTSSMQVLSLKTPYSPSSLGDSIPYASSTTLSATGGPNDILIWYNSINSLNELDRTTYTTPILYEADTFYVGAMIIGFDTIQLGDSTAFSAAYPSPLNATNKYSKEQYLYKASELSALGLSEGNINSIMFNIKSVASQTNLLDYSIKIGTTNQELLSSWTYGLTEVYSDTNLSLPATTLGGWKNFQFSDPFYYDGTSNLVIEVCYTRSGTTSKNIKTYFTNTPFNSTIFYNSATTNACAWTGAASAGIRTQRPNAKFDIDKFGCSSVRTPVIVEVAPPPG